MSKFKIEIAEPCQENWGAMTKSEQGKFCGSCQKNVIDFTGYSNYEIGQFLGKPENANTCGRFSNTQIAETYNYYKPEKASNFLKYAAGIAGTLLLVQAFEGCQETPNHCEGEVQESKIMPSTVFNDLNNNLDNNLKTNLGNKLKDEKKIRGILINKQTGKPFENPQIEVFTYVLEGNNFKLVSAYIDKNGYFSLNYDSDVKEDIRLSIDVYKDSSAVDKYDNIAFATCSKIEKRNVGNIHYIEIDTLNDRNIYGIVGQASCTIIK
ncbi:MAG: hypothetical protein RI894_171 [Bacteroidota bacterium]|jgi:hypothetical protein